MRPLVADCKLLGLKGIVLKEWSHPATFVIVALLYDRPAIIGKCHELVEQGHLESTEAEYTARRIVFESESARCA
jgi:hypothetical protein